MIQPSSTDARAIANASSTALVAAAMFLVVPAVVMIQFGAVPHDVFTLLQFVPYVVPPLLLIVIAIPLRASRRGGARHLVTALHGIRVYAILQLAFALLATVMFAAAFVTGAITF